MSKEPLTEERIAEISSRLHGVSLGEWSHGYSLDVKCNAITCEGRHLIWFVHPDPLKNDKNMEFVASARQDMGALLEEVERLRAENKRLEQAANWLANMLEYHVDGCCPLRFAIENGESIPKIDGCKGTYLGEEVGDPFECRYDENVRVSGLNCWVEAAVKVTSEDGNHE